MATKRNQKVYEDGENRSADFNRPVNTQVTSNALKMKLDHLQTFEPLTANQGKFFEAYKRGDYFMALLGSPGVGKTFLSLYRAIEDVMSRDTPYKEIVIVRSAVQVRDQGFMPGDINEKMEIYEAPYHDIFATLFQRKDAYERLKEQHFVRFISTTALRGVTFDSAIVVVDECQSMTFHELSTVISRTGDRSKIIFVGDLKQNDLVKSRNDVSGLRLFLDVANKMSEFSRITFTPDDIVRSSLVKSWIIACESHPDVP
jgi:predicted ribonuclease YlaK